MDVVVAPELEITEAGEQIRALIAEAEGRGTPMISAEAMQARMFVVYDAAAVSDDALGRVQKHLTLTLSRTWFSSAEVSELADQIDWALTVGTQAEAPA